MSTKLDFNELAKSIVDMATGSDKSPKNPAAVALGRLGGKKGGRARADKLSAEQRSAIAKLAAEKRWKDKKERKGRTTKELQNELGISGDLLEKALSKSKLKGESQSK